MSSSALLRTAQFFRPPGLGLSLSREFIDHRISTSRYQNFLDYYTQRQLPVLEGIAEETGLPESEIESLLEPELVVETGAAAGVSSRAILHEMEENDVSNDALHDASQSWNREPSVIGQSKDSPIGLVHKR